jgi:adenosylcobyric acid synthase
MLGKIISDPDGIEGSPGTVEGLGYLNVETILTADKSTVAARATHVASGAPVSGYEIHVGRTSGPDCTNPMMRLDDGRSDGAVSADGRVYGTYIHGLFTADAFRTAYLNAFGVRSDLCYDQDIDRILDDLAGHLDSVLDVEAILKIARGADENA